MDVTQYPEGFEKLYEELGFLPEDEAVREEFMIGIMQFLLSW